MSIPITTNYIIDIGAIQVLLLLPLLLLLLLLLVLLLLLLLLLLLYSEINGEMVRQAALRTKGAGGPSGIDANGFHRIMASKSFKQSSSRLCEAIATVTKIFAYEIY